jgi:stage IV sporulation protein FB
MIVPLLLIVGYVGQLQSFFIAFICIVIHECGHILAAKVFNVNIEKIQVLPIGLAAKLKRNYDSPFEEEFLLHIAGPIANVLFCILGLLVYLCFPNEIILIFCSTNLFLCAFNLMPLFPLDGGKIIHLIFRYEVSFLNASNKYLKLSKILAYIIITPALGLFIYVQNFSLLMICLFIIYAIHKSQDEVNSQPYLDIVYKKQIVKNKDMIIAKYIAAHKSTKLFDIAKEFNLRQFCFVAILDEQMKVIKMVGEVEIIEYIFEHHVSSTLEELI